jgi:DNA-binding CsgD family transcriptional regulator
VTAFLTTGTLPESPPAAVRAAEPAPVPAPVPAGAAITPRELDVLRLVAAGDSNPEIARALGITVHTVERHTANLYRKIGARGRADAVAYALRRGLA